MDQIYEQWQKALKYTEVIRPRIKPLSSYETTKLPYVFLTESVVNKDTTVVRTGQVMVEKPSIILPPNMPQLNGFEEADNGSCVDFLLVRGIYFPSYKYNNKVQRLDIYNDKLNKALKHYREELQKSEDVHTGLVLGPEDAWSFSILIFVCMMASRAAESDVKRLLDEYKES